MAKNKSQLALSINGTKGQWDAKSGIALKIKSLISINNTRL
jgi:hypothetical protein